MNKYEFQQRLEEGEELCGRGKYLEAVDVFDLLNLDLLKQPVRLTKIAKAYEKCRRYQDAEDLLLQAYEYSPRSRSILFHLCTIALKAGEVDDAKKYYQDFIAIAKYDSERFVLQYRIAKAEGKDDETLMAILEDLKAEEPDDRWMYELAKLYAKNYRKEDALALCDEIDVWFYSGKYVVMAHELRAEILGENLPHDLITDEMPSDTEEDQVKIRQDEREATAKVVEEIGDIGLPEEFFKDGPAETDPSVSDDAGEKAETEPEKDEENSGAVPDLDALDDYTVVKVTKAADDRAFSEEKVSFSDTEEMLSDEMNSEKNERTENVSAEEEEAETKRESSEQEAEDSEEQPAEQWTENLREPSEQLTEDLREPSEQKAEDSHEPSEQLTEDLREPSEQMAEQPAEADLEIKIGEEKAEETLNLALMDAEELEKVLLETEKEQGVFGVLPVNEETTEDTWHFLVYGENNALTLECARERMKEIVEMAPVAPERMLRISAEKMMGADIINSLDRFLGNMVIVEQAGSLSDEQLRAFAKILEKDDRSLLLAFTDSKRDMIDMLKRVPELQNSFTAVYEAKEYRVADLVAIVKQYLHHLDAKMTGDGEAEAILYARKVLASESGFYRSRMREYADKAYSLAVHGGFLGISVGKVDYDGMLCVQGKHFRKAGETEETE